MTQYKDKFREIEKKWQKRWEEEKVFEAKDLDESREKFYCLVEFPYPSGVGLHMGHPKSYYAMDVVCRKKRMEGKNVLYPFGWDAFGLPAENYAIKVKKHPTVTVGENIENFKSQIKNLGIGFDWSREINTTDPKYYRWTQWMFLQFFKAGLAYKAKFPINWCPKCKIGIANEELEKGKCERCGSEVEQREKEQWMLKMTLYADRLIDDLDTVDYLSEIVSQQKNWIGRSEGINIRYDIEGVNEEVEVFTTRPDTNFGATFIVIAPEAKFTKKNFHLFSNKEEIEDYIEKSLKKNELERISEGRKKTGVFTGLYAINKLNERRMPIYVSDFVLATVGTGAVVGVPGHDLRDFEFAQEKKLEIIRVVVGPDGDSSSITTIEQVQESAGTMINSDFLDGLDIHEATEKIKDYIEEKGWGKRTITYRLRDWVFSRQRYWGEPIPLVYCEVCGWVPVLEDDLPVELPAVESYEPTDTGESPLANITEWVNTTCPKCGKEAKRETDTMPNWAGSSWYWLRYMDPQNATVFADMEKMKYWDKVDLYNGGMEHATRHLLYARFWHKVLYDLGLAPTSEPFKKRIAQGLVLAEDGTKMSKSKGNGVDPDDIVRDFGTDTLKTYMMFMGPYEEAVPWSTQGLVGVNRFLNRVWDWVTGVSFGESASRELEILLHKTIQKVSNDIDTFQFNTAVSSLMVYLNEASKVKEIPKEYVMNFLLLLYPFAPHISSELWEVKVDSKKSLYAYDWPKYDENKLQEEMLHLVIQVNGKVRDEFEVSRETSEEEIKKQALQRSRIQSYLDGKEPKKIIYVSQKLVSIVVE